MRRDEFSNQNEERSQICTSSDALIVYPSPTYNCPRFQATNLENLLNDGGKSFANLLANDPHLYALYRDYHFSEQHRHSTKQRVYNQHYQKQSLLEVTCEETLATILSFLDGMSLCRSRSVCQLLNELSQNERYWLNLCRMEWSISPTQLHNPPKSYYALYKLTYLSLKRLIRDFMQEQCMSTMQHSFRTSREVAAAIARRMMVA
ncbi:hypothetical protein ABG067_000119 [Albugo candida]|uniref:F-box domain-containing protein n=1 Tax=Albugo candida TaxID=65357 RepID=A0A024GRL1_9STRA|nr:unnamed protein product [Albugo candida]|eukprot:CCI49365.1 unnamed protein product [Albugo candida]